MYSIINLVTSSNSTSSFTGISTFEPNASSAMKVLFLSFLLPNKASYLQCIKIVCFIERKIMTD